MPKKKQVRNGFYWYMQDLIPELKREGHIVNGIATAVPLAHPRWKALSPQDKEIYEEKAKVEKRKEQMRGGPTHSAGQVRDTRLDNVGQLIASRVSPEEEALKRRAKESRITKSRWPQGEAALEEMLDYQFYLISFEYLCEVEVDEIKSYYPIEVGVIEYTMRHGITRKFHRHLKPAPVPLGYRYECMHHGEETHQIPIEGHEEADSNYLGIYIQLENFINPGGTKKEYPAMFALGTHLACAESCLEWIHEQARPGHPSRLRKVFELENMVVDLIQLAGEPAISRAPVLDVLSSCQWDYEANTRCDYHEEMGNKHCALYSVQNWAYLLSDFLADIYKFNLIPGKHQPEPADQEFIAIPPPKIERRPPPVTKTSSSYSSMVEEGGYSFGGRDIRPEQKRIVINIAQGDDDSDSGTDFDSVLEMELSHSDKQNDVIGGAGRGIVLPSGVNPGPGWGRGTVAPPMDDDDEFPALGAPGPAKPRQPHVPTQAQRFAAPAPPSESSVSAPPASVAVSVVSGSQYDSDEETDVLSNQGSRKKTLHEAVREKEKAERMRKSRPAGGPAGNDPKLMSSNGPGGGRGPSAPRAVNVNNSTGFKPSLGNISLPANVGQGRGALLSGMDSVTPGGRGRGRGRGVSSASSVTSFVSSQNSSQPKVAAPRPVNVNNAWTGVGRGLGVKPPAPSGTSSKPSAFPAPSGASSMMSGYSDRASMMSYLMNDDTESLASSAATGSVLSGAGRGRGVWTAKKKPVQPPPGFGMGNTLAEKLHQIEINESQFEDSDRS